MPATCTSHRLLNMNWTTVDRSVEALDFMPERVRELATHLEYRYAPGSQADVEVRQCRRPSRLAEAYVHGTRQYLFVALDHMLGLSRMLSPQPIRLSLSPWTCSRVILESCAKAVWLLSTDISAEQRVTRSLNSIQYDQEQLRKYLNSISKNDPSSRADEQYGSVMRKLEERIQILQADAKSMNIVPKFDKKNRLIGFGNERSTALERIVSTLGPDMEEWYRSYSAILHGSEWATLALGAKVDPASGRKAAVQEISPSHAMSLVALSMRFFALAAWNHFGLYGWNVEALKRILDTAYDHALPNSNDRFWRSERPIP